MKEERKKQRKKENSYTLHGIWGFYLMCVKGKFVLDYTTKPYGSVPV
jgi:hypothetical protein